MGRRTDSDITTDFFTVFAADVSPSVLHSTSIFLPQWASSWPRNGKRKRESSPAGFGNILARWVLCRSCGLVVICVSKLGLVVICVFHVVHQLGQAVEGDYFWFINSVWLINVILLMVYWFRVCVCVCSALWRTGGMPGDESYSDYSGLHQDSRYAHRRPEWSSRG